MSGSERGFSGLTAREIVVQSTLIHPDWNVETHAHFLREEEGVNLEHIGEPGDRTPAETISRWVSEVRS